MTKRVPLAGALALLLAMFMVPASAAHVIPGPPTTTLNEQPTGVHGNPDCADLLPATDFLFEHKTGIPTDETIPLSFDGLSGSVTVDVQPGSLFDFSFTGDFAAAAVIVKGGPNANFYDYRPDGATADTGLHAPVNPQNNKFFGLSHISFCIIEAQAELDIQKTPDGGIVDVGDNASFTLTVTNISGVTASNVVIDDTLPNGRFTWTEGPDTAECTVTGGNVLHCDVGDLAAGASFSVTVSTPTDRDDCGDVLNPDAMADADNAPADSDSGSLRVRCGAIEITKTAKHKDTSGATQPNLDAGFTIDDAGDLDPVVVSTGADGMVCIDGLRVGAATVTETGVPAGYAAPGPKNVEVTEGSCAGATAISVEFENEPLTDVDITVDSQVDGATETTIVCRDAEGNIVSQTTVSDGTLSLDDLTPQTLNCQIVIDP